ncbi:MAG TPA: hypothetical protein VM033_00720 [Gemmatimonadaceae bacterium]|nr:hypothetical protein [Gemmatimonadaceae bacterium]
MTTIRNEFSRAALGVLLFAGGCAQLRAANASPSPVDEGALTATLQRAEREAFAFRFSAADRLLSDFATSHPNTSAAVETGFWRAMFKLDAANQFASPRDAIAMFDSYLAISAPVSHRGAASALRRVAIALDRPATVVVTVPGGSAGGRADAKSDTRPDDKARDEEVQRLKDELAKANAELERIKRRLAQPNP